MEYTTAFALQRSKKLGEAACKPDSVPLRAMVIPLDPTSRLRFMRPTHPAPTLSGRMDRASPSRVYLVLLRGEITSFHPFDSRRRTRLCGSYPSLTGDGCYPLRCPVESGLSSPAETGGATIRPPLPVTIIACDRGRSIWGHTGFPQKTSVSPNGASPVLLPESGLSSRRSRQRGLFFLGGRLAAKRVGDGSVGQTIGGAVFFAGHMVDLKVREALDQLPNQNMEPLKLFVFHPVFAVDLPDQQLAVAENHDIAASLLQSLLKGQDQSAMLGDVVGGFPQVDREFAHLPAGPGRQDRADTGRARVAPRSAVNLNFQGGFSWLGQCRGFERRIRR